MITFRAVWTSHEDKSPIDRFGEIITNKSEENETKEEWYIIKLKKKPGPAMFTIYSKKYPILREVWNRCNKQEKAIISEACRIVYNKKLDKAIDEGNIREEDVELLNDEQLERYKKGVEKKKKQSNPS